jgi:hypothetical protein
VKVLALLLIHAAAASSNWAGYAVTGQTFTDVKSTWVQPAVTCPATGSSYAAFWVGLGGVTGSGGLEQTGTEADCQNGHASYSAWYELLPDGSVQVPVAVNAGDTMSAEVAADTTAGTATLTLTDVTTSQTFTTQQTPSTLDTSSAEWIAEAPSQCLGGDHCLQLPLANFASVQFSGSSTTANGHVGTISDAGWSATSIDLGGGAGSAVPAALSPDGTAFAVAFTPPAPVQPFVTPRKRRHHHRI